jgi:hypothetical protein
MEKISWTDCFVFKKRAYVLGSLSTMEKLACVTLAVCQNLCESKCVICELCIH